MQTLFEHYYTITGLLPFTDYKFQVEARNSFTEMDTKYGKQKIFTTSEGGQLESSKVHLHQASERLDC